MANDPDFLEWLDKFSKQHCQASEPKTDSGGDRKKAEAAIKAVIKKLGPVRQHHRAGSTDSAYSQRIGNIIAKLQGELASLESLDAETVSTLYSYTRTISDQLDPPANPQGIASTLEFLAKYRKWGGAARIRTNQAGLYFGHMNPAWKSPQEQAAQKAKQEFDKAKLDKAQSDLKAKGPELVAKLKAAADGLEKKNRPSDAAQVRKMAVDWQKKLAELAAEQVGPATTAGGVAGTVGNAGNVVTGGLEPAGAGKVAARAGVIITVATGTVATVDAIARGDGAGAIKNLTVTGVQVGLSFAGPVGTAILIGWGAAGIILGAVTEEGAAKVGAAVDLQKKYGAKIAIEWLKFMSVGGAGQAKLHAKKMPEPPRYLYTGKHAQYHQWKVYNPSWPEPRGRIIQTTYKDLKLAQSFAHTHPDQWEKAGLNNEAFRDAEKVSEAHRNAKK